jgi:hypothetical protein
VTPGPRIEAVLGRADDMRAEVYVRLTDPPVGGGAVIQGVVSGPRCSLATTLPTLARLEQLAGGDPVARAILTEPSYWTPEMPNLYRLQAEAHVADASVAAVDWMIGLRRLGVRGRSLWLDGRRWVPRGAASTPPAFDLTGFRAAAMAAVVREPTEEQCTAADTAGVALIAVADPAVAGDPAAQIAAWARHPSVVIAVVSDAMGSRDGGTPLTALGPLKGTMLAGLAVDGATPPGPVPPGIDCLVVRLPPETLPHAAWREQPPALPLIASWAGAATGPVSRAGCDRLQAALAAWGCAGSSGTPAWDWAGYLLT